MSEKTMVRDLTEGSVAKKLTLFALPLVLSGILQLVYNMVDMIVVGRFIGSAGQSAVSIGGDLLNFLTFTTMGFASAGEVCISQYVGAGQKKRIGKMIGTMFTFLFLMAVVVCAVCLILRGNILHWLNTPEESYAYAMQYFVTCVIGLVFIYGYNIVSSILRGMGDSKHPFMFIATAAIINLVLDLLFVVKCRWGVLGAALATVIGQSISFIWALIFLRIRRDRFGFDFRLSSFRIDKECLKPLIRLGLPLALQSAAVNVSLMVLNSWINAYGVIVSAVNGIGAKISSTANVFSHAVSSAAANMIGQAIGAKKFTRVKKVLAVAFVFSFAVSIALSVVILLFPKQVFGLFNKEPEVLALSMSYVPVTVVLFLGTAFRSPMMSLITGSGNSKLNLVVAIIDGIVARIGFALLLGRVFQLGVVGYWYGHAIAGFMPFFIGGVFYLTGNWYKKRYIMKD